MSGRRRYVSKRGGRGGVRKPYTVAEKDLPHDFRVLLAQFADQEGLFVPERLTLQFVAVAPLAAEVRAELEKTGGWEDGRGDEGAYADPVEREWDYVGRMATAMRAGASFAPLLLGGPRTILSDGPASLWDGRHRVIAAEMCGVKVLPAIDIREWERS